MYSHEKADYPGNRGEISFSIWNTSARLPGQKSFAKTYCFALTKEWPDDMILSRMYFHLRSKKINSIAKVPKVDKATIYSRTIQPLCCFLNFITVDRADFPDENKIRQNSSQQHN